MPKSCSIEGCERPHYARALCRPHYKAKWDKANAERIAAYETDRRQKPSRREAERQRTQQRRGYIDAWLAGHKDWGAWWARLRYWEDKRDLKQFVEARGLPAPSVASGKASQRISQRPRTRQFIAGRCPDCDKPVVVIRGWWHDSIRCSECTTLHWRGNHIKRARRNGVEWERISSETIFQRDGRRCQLCGRKTHGKFPAPTSPTVDHIIPLSKGGPHLEHNLQTACLRCNGQKHNGAANDQLRLAVSAN